jgi:hypothetical protein
MRPSPRAQSVFQSLWAPAQNEATVSQVADGVREGALAFNASASGSARGPGRPWSDDLPPRRQARPDQPIQIDLNQLPWHLLTNPHWNALLASPREAWELAWNYHDREFFGHLVLARVLPTFRCRGRIRTSVRAALQGQGGPNSENNRPLVRNRQVNGGGILLAKQPGFQGEIPPQCVGDLLNPGFVVQPENARYVRRLLRLAAEYNIAVYWLLPPTSSKVIASRDQSGVHAWYNRFVRSMQAQFPNVSVVDARHAGYQDSVFVDPVHLDRDGALALSGAVADVLQNALSHAEPVPRWVELPTYRDRDRGVTVRLEDVDQSRMALRRSDPTRRR